MNKINNDLPMPDQAVRDTSPSKLGDRQVASDTQAIPRTKESAPAESKPLSSRKAEATTSEFRSLLKALRNGPLEDKDSDSITAMLEEIGITPAMKKIPNNLSETLLRTTEFEPDVKVFILDHLKDKLEAQHSDVTLNQTIAEMTQANETDKVIESIQMNWHKNAFEQKLHIILIRYMATSPEAKTQVMGNLDTILKSINYQDLNSTLLQDAFDLTYALEDIFDERFNSFITRVSEQIFDALQETKAIGKPIPKETLPPLSPLARAELQKVFSDEEVAKLMAFLQTKRKTAHQKILHFEKVKVNKEAMADLMASPEFQDLLKSLESQIFTDDLRKDFDNLVLVAQNPESSKETIKTKKRDLKKIEKKMIANLNKTMKNLQTEILTGKELNGTNAEIASKLSTLVKVAGDKKIATRDMFKIILKRIGLGIGLCITALFAGAAICAIFIALVKASIIIIPAALTVSIIVGVTMLIFGATGFSVGAFGNVDVRKKFKSIMGHIATFGTNMNVRFTDQALAPGVDKMVQAM